MREVRAPTDAEPDISVVLPTYNHAPYLLQAIASVLNQRTERRVELIISDDCSTDGGLEIAKRAAEEDPRIRLLVSPANLRSNEVIARAIGAARGKYICMLDGDDHWLVPDKLERQAAVLDANPSASACFHNAAVVPGASREVSEQRWTPGAQPPVTGEKEIWHGNPFATSAGMLRRQALKDLGSWYNAFFPITDWPLYILCAQHGPLLFVDEVVAAYRLHSAGLFSSLTERSKLESIGSFYERMNRALNYRSNDHAKAGEARFFLEWAEVYSARNDRSMARWCAWRALRSGGIVRDVTLLGRWSRMAFRAIV